MARSVFFISLGLAMALTVVPLYARTAHADPASQLRSIDHALTPAEKVALSDGGAPPPPDGYEVTEDFDYTLRAHSYAVRSHQALGLPGAEARQDTQIPNDAPSHFSLLGWPVKFNAPISPPYTNSVYHNYAGSPGNGQTSIVAQSDAAGTWLWDNNQRRK